MRIRSSSESAERRSGLRGPTDCEGGERRLGEEAEEVLSFLGGG